MSHSMQHSCLSIKEQTLQKGYSLKAAELLVSSLYRHYDDTSNTYSKLVVRRRPSSFIWAFNNNVCIPEELYEIILSYLPLNTLLTARFANKKFSAIAGRVALSRCRSVSSRSAFMKLMDALPASSVWRLNVKTFDLTQLPSRSLLVTDKYLYRISAFPDYSSGLGLTTVILSNCRLLTDDGLISMLHRCQFVRVLDLSGCDKITDALFNTISLPKLERLLLFGCLNLTNRTLAGLEKSKALRSLSVSFAKSINGEGLVQLSKDHSQTLRQLDIRGCGKVADSHLLQIASNAYRLDSLSLQFNYGNLTFEGIRLFLRKLYLTSLRITLPLVPGDDGGWRRMEPFDEEKLAQLKHEFPWLTFVQ